jgi:serine phosphatase RsbU (regulator of sigma subunit)
MLEGEVFATMILARYLPQSGEIELVCAGHPAPLRIAHGGAGGVATRCAMPLGVQRGTTFPASSYRILPGESLLILTDGVTEARNQAGELFDETTLGSAFVRMAAPPYGPGLLQAVKAFSSREELWRRFDHLRGLARSGARGAGPGQSGRP